MRTRPWRARRCRRARPTRSSSSPPTAARSAPSARLGSRSTRPTASDALAVISLDAIAGVGPPRLLIAGDTARSPAAALVRTAAVRVLEQSGREPERASGTPPAARPRLSVHLRRAGAVRRPRHPGGDAHHRPGRPVAGLRRRPAQRRAPGRARPRDPEPRRLARRRPRACAGNDELRLPRSAIRPGLDDRARAPDGALAVPDRNDRSLRPVPAAARSPRSGRAQPAQPPSLLGLRRPAALRRRQARRLPGRGAAAPPGRPRPVPALAGRPRRCSACCCSAVGSSPASG